MAGGFIDVDGLARFKAKLQQTSVMAPTYETTTGNGSAAFKVSAPTGGRWFVHGSLTWTPYTGAAPERVEVESRFYEGGETIVSGTALFDANETATATFTKQGILCIRVAE